MSVPAEVRISALAHEPATLQPIRDNEWRVSAVLSHFVEQNLAKVPGIASIATSLNISASRLRRIFKQKTGVSFGRYIKTVRLQRARKLLQETRLSVKQVRIEVGLFDHSHFARDYKKEFGESPSETRRSRTPGQATTRSATPRSSDLGYGLKLA
ncbi:MAG TPA: helix-turn-helix transcriptional regulator [Candidatus Angelobacter sp.]|jgi:transcriptional regulator GlxA family with amidase domain|nr:helix-turn-helix transcriptional regulator [Candidatus Angelobacter sp.]